MAETFGCVVFILLLAVVNLRCQKPIAGSEANMCKFDRWKTRTVLRKNITTTTEYHTKKCGIPSNPELQCPETRVYSRIYWYPIKRTEHYDVIKCCPGWSNYVINIGCTKRTGCEIVLPQYDNQMCKIIRMRHKMYNRMHYKLTTPIDPNDPKRTFKDLVFPTMNQTSEDILTRTMMDPYTSNWFNVYFYGMLKRNNATLTAAQQMFRHLTFDRIEDYLAVYNFMMPLQEKVKLPYFKLPSMQSGFRNIVYDRKWESDQVFVEQRLAGLNPMALQKVSLTGDVGISFGKLVQSLNQTFDWNKALSEAIGEETSLERMAERGLLFAVDYPIYHDISHVPDIMDEDPNDKRILMRSTSPIGLFAIGKDAKGVNELKIVAIQMNYKPASEVRTSKDGNKWMFAKAFLQEADFAVVEIYEHLLRTHVRFEPICVCMHRHLAPTHPLYAFFRVHCRGLIPTNSYGFPRLTKEQMYMHRLFDMGHVGTLEILNNGYLNMKWKDNDLLVNIKARGVDDPEVLPYYPYRDDGKVIHKVVESFARDLVDLYYKSDSEVISDEEMQSLVDELSADGSGSVDSAKGKIVGFPAKLTNREELADIITQVIWLVVQHAAVNYPIAAYGSFAPNMPTKLYRDPEHKDFGQYTPALPKGITPILQSFVTLNLGTMRYDKLFDYSKLIEDGEGKLLVTRYFDQLTKEIQPLLEDRNKRRFAEGHLTYQYLEPKWLPNSIHT